MPSFLMPSDKIDVAIKRIDYAKDVATVPYFNNPNGQLALAGLEKQVDLAYGEALYVSQGGNKNGYYFTNNLLLQYYKTTLMKPINVGHNQQFIIGAMYDAAISKRGDPKSPEPLLSIIEDSRIHFDQKKLWYIDDYAGEIDLWVKFVLFKGIYPSVVDTIKENVSGNTNIDKFFISMEILHNNYMYLWDEDESTAFARTVANSNLDEFIGRTVEGKRLYKMYIGQVAFGGGGIVGDPANPRSVLSDVAQRDVAYSKQSIILEGTTYKTQGAGTVSPGGDGNVRQTETETEKYKFNGGCSMDPKDVASIVEQVEQRVTARIDALKKEQSLDEATARIQAQSAELTAVTTKLAAKEQELSDLSSASVAAQKDLQDKLDAAQTQIEGYKTSIADLESKKMSDEDKAALDKYRAADRAEKRLAEITSEGVKFDEAKKSEIKTKLGNLTDDAYVAYKAALKDVAQAAPAAASAAVKPAAPAANAGVQVTTNPDVVLSQAVQGGTGTSTDTASTGTGDKRANFKKALTSITSRSSKNPTGAGRHVAS